MQLINEIDTAILLFFQNYIRSRALDPVMKAASFLGDAALIWIFIGLVLLIHIKTRRAGIETLACLAVSTAINNLIFKNLIQRPRPYLVIEELSLLIKPLPSYSFPSGHSCGAFACATALYLTFRKNRYAALVFLPAAVISLSRAYVGIHYLSDVVAGAALGAFSAWCVCRICKRYNG